MLMRRPTCSILTSLPSQSTGRPLDRRLIPAARNRWKSGYASAGLKRRIVEQPSMCALSKFGYFAASVQSAGSANSTGAPQISRRRQPPKPRKSGGHALSWGQARGCNRDRDGDRLAGNHVGGAGQRYRQRSDVTNTAFTGQDWVSGGPGVRVILPRWPPETAWYSTQSSIA